jgi:hypothetical protein
MNKSIDELYSIAKLYNKYLITVKTKINNTNTQNIENIHTFKEYSETAEQLFDELNNEWFFLSNCDNIKSFRLKNNDINECKNNFYVNYNALEHIAIHYGFENWYTTAKYKSSSSSSPTNKTFINNTL